MNGEAGTTRVLRWYRAPFVPADISPREQRETLISCRLELEVEVIEGLEDECLWGCSSVGKSASMALMRVRGSNPLSSTNFRFFPNELRR